MKKRVIVLGSTGSIGRQSLDVLREMADEWEVVGLATGSRADALARQANRVRPGAVALVRQEDACPLQEALDYQPVCYGGEGALVELVEQTPCDCVISAVVGTGGLKATLKAIEMGRRVALANKEALVIAGSLLTSLALSTGGEIIPIDSEHSAVFQAMHAGRREDVRRIYLTASGGPFRTWSLDAMTGAGVEDALRHPTWAMGPKTTIDSATMMNKALEIVEARWLFDLEPEKIKVVVHPESIVHSMVEFCDGNVIAQLGTPDMRTPIQYALTYPKRRPGSAEPLDLLVPRELHFEPPDEARFPALRLGYETARRGGTSGAVLNAANEQAVTMFREGRIGFLDIALYTQRALTNHDRCMSPSLQDLLSADQWARRKVAQCIPCS